MAREPGAGTRCIGSHALTVQTFGLFGAAILFDAMAALNGINASAISVFQCFVLCPTMSATISFTISSLAFSVLDKAVPYLAPLPQCVLK